MSDKEWAVVQNLLPFGYRIEATYRSRRRAERRARWSRYLTVMPTKRVRAANRRLEDMDEFDRELRRYQARKGR